MNKLILSLVLVTMLVVASLVNYLLFNIDLLTILLLIFELVLLVFILIITISKTITNKLFSSQQKYTSTTVNHRIDNVLLRETLSEVQKVLEQTVNIAESELSRVASLIKDAVSGMSTSFMHLQTLTFQQQSIIAVLLKQVQGIRDSKENTLDLSKGVDELSLLTPKIDIAVGVGIRSLQFDDLTFQTIANLREELHGIKTLSHQFEELTQLSFTEDKEHLLQIKHHAQQIKQSMDKANQNRMVTQSTMDEGEIELF